MTEVLVEATICLRDIETDVLLEELSDRGRYPHVEDLERAGDYFRRGDVAEALIWLERALPDTFAGLSTAAVPARGVRP